MTNVLQPHQQRVVNEKQELDEKLVKLCKFVSSPNFEAVVTDQAEQQRLVRQMHIMQGYSNILHERIQNFKGE